MCNFARFAIPWANEHVIYVWCHIVCGRDNPKDCALDSCRSSAASVSISGSGGVVSWSAVTYMKRKDLVTDYDCNQRRGRTGR